MTPPNATGTTTERESKWPFVIEAKVIAVPAPLARLGIGLLVAQVVAIAIVIFILLTSPPYVLVRGG